MELRVNNEKIDIKLEGEKTVGDVLKAFEAEAAKNEATTISIKLNGNDIPPDGFEEAIKTPIAEDTLLELVVVSKAELILALKECAAKFESYSNELKNIPVLLQTAKEAEANAIIIAFADQIDSFCHTATLSALFNDIYENLKIAGEPIEKFFEEFAPLLQDFENAYQEKDTVTMGDLAEYEISPRLTKLSESLKANFN